MTSAVALALMAKASAVFGGSDTFLSFPLTPISFTKEQLDFLTDAAVHPSAALENASQFAYLVNQVPSGPVWPTVDTGPLWKEYTRIMKQAELANEQRTPAEEAQYQAAMAFLYVTGPDGLRTSSPAVIAYNQYRDAYLNAKQQYTSRKIAADASTDPSVKAQWATDEPTLQTIVNATLTAWQTQGLKGQVDDARRVQESLGAKSPSITWTQWADLCDPLTVGLTDAENRSFMPTAFAPSSAIDSPIWQQFSLSASEVAQLVSQAPKELAARLGPDQQLDIASVRFECTSVTITRPWFSPDVFDARFWKLNSAPTVVSDGQTPPKGTIPGYTVAIVFARNLEVELTGTSAPPPASDNTPVTIGPLHAATIVDGTGNRLILQRPIADPVDRSEIRPMMMARPMMTARPLDATETAPAMSAVAVAQPITRPAMLMQLQTLNYVRIPTPQPAPPQPQPAQPPPQPSPFADEIFVLGFICKQVALCPNPDPSLPW